MSDLDPGDPVHAGQCEEEEAAEGDAPDDPDVVVPTASHPAAVVHYTVPAGHRVLQEVAERLGEPHGVGSN